MEKINLSSYEQWALEDISTVAEILKKKNRPILIIIDGQSGAGKDFIIDKALKFLDENGIKSIKTLSKKSTRPPRKDELNDSKKSRSGTNILNDEEFGKIKKFFEYKYCDNSYAIGFEELKKELSSTENKIVFVPIAEFSKMDDMENDGNAGSNFARFYNKIKKEFPNTNFLNISIKSKFDSVEALNNRKESTKNEISNRVRQHLINPCDRVYKQALINRGFIKTISNYGGKEGGFAEIYNLINVLKDFLQSPAKLSKY